MFIGEFAMHATNTVRGLLDIKRHRYLEVLPFLCFLWILWIVIP
jgi:hypothetical protein